MATKCIDISDDKKMGSISPIAIFVWAGIFIVLTAFMDPGFTYVLLLLISGIFVGIFFQFTPRFIFLMMKFLATNSYLTPSFVDKTYLADEKMIKSLARIIQEEESV